MGSKLLWKKWLACRTPFWRYLSSSGWGIICITVMSYDMLWLLLPRVWQVTILCCTSMQIESKGCFCKSNAFLTAVLEGSVVAWHPIWSWAPGGVVTRPHRFPKKQTAAVLTDRGCAEKNRGGAWQVILQNLQTWLHCAMDNWWSLDWKQQLFMFFDHLLTIFWMFRKFHLPSGAGKSFWPHRGAAQRWALAATGHLHLAEQDRPCSWCPQNNGGFVWVAVATFEMKGDLKDEKKKRVDKLRSCWKVNKIL